jgi:hypothetical protein
MSYSKTDEEKSLLEPVKAIRSAELYYGSGSVGDRYLIVDGDDTETSQFVGAYPNTIKANGARWEMNVTGTIDNLLTLNQNFIGLSTADLSGTPYDDTSGNYWPQLVSFLSQSQDTNIKVFAVCEPRAFIPSGSVNRWGLRGGRLKNDEYVDPAPIAAKKWSAAALELSALSALYPNLMGWTIDDFAAKNDNRISYTAAQVRGMVSAGRRWNPSFQFFPTHYVNAALKNAIPATRVGFSYSFPTIANEFVEATLRFKMPATVPTTANIHFLHSDEYIENAHPTVMKTMKVNGKEVFSDNFKGDDRVETTSANIQSSLVPGLNHLQVYVSSSAITNEFISRVWSIGDIRIETNSDKSHFRNISRENRRLAAPIFNRNNNVAYSASCCARWKGRAVSETNELYRYVAECPRTILVYSNHTGAIQARLGTIFAAYNRTLPDTGLFHVQQGFLFNQAIPPTSVVQKFKSGSAYSDGQLIWNYPDYLQQPNKRTVPALDN